MCLYLVQHMLHQIKAQQFYNDLGLYQLCQVLQKIVEFKDFSRLLCGFPVLFKADLIFKGLFKKAILIQELFKLVQTLSTDPDQTSLIRAFQWLLL